MWVIGAFEAARHSGVVDGLNRNSGAIQAVTTIVLVLVTTWYAFLSHQMVRAMRTSQRPYVYIDITSQGGRHLELSVANYGERAAEEVAFRILRDLSGSDGKPISEGTPLARGIRYLPPGRGYRFFVVAPDGVYDGGPGENVLDLKVTYSYGGKLYEDRLTIDFADFDGVLLKSFRDSGDEIARSIKGLADEIRQRQVQESLSSMWQPDKKACPVCHEHISDEALKCPQCLEWIPVTPRAGATDALPPEQSARCSPWRGFRKLARSARRQRSPRY